MDQFQKKIAFWMGVVFMVVLIGYISVGTSKDALRPATEQYTVSFTGEGKVLAKPDVAIVDASILTEAKTAKEAQNSNSEKSKTLVDFLKGQGIAEKDIKTTAYNIYPQYSYPRPCPVGSLCPEYTNSNPKITGYQVSQTVQVKIRDLEKADTILDGMVTAGANQVGSLQLTIDNKEVLKSQARAKAISDAKAKAKELRGQLDIDLGKIVNFSENTSGWPQPYYGYAKAMDSSVAMESAGPAIEAGENEITVNVTITYQVK